MVRDADAQAGRQWGGPLSYAPRRPDFCSISVRSMIGELHCVSCSRRLRIGIEDEILKGKSDPDQRSFDPANYLLSPHSVN